MESFRPSGQFCTERMSMSFCPVSFCAVIFCPTPPCLCVCVCVHVCVCALHERRWVCVHIAAITCSTACWTKQNMCGLHVHQWVAGVGFLCALSLCVGPSVYNSEHKCSYYTQYYVHALVHNIMYKRLTSTGHSILNRSAFGWALSHTHEWIRACLFTTTPLQSCDCVDWMLVWSIFFAGAWLPNLCASLYAPLMWINVLNAKTENKRV